MRQTGYIMVLAALSAGWLNGCARHTAVIPDLDTAQAQYTLAFLKTKGDIPPAEAAALRNLRLKQIALYQKVVTRFPDDGVYTPQAILSIAQTYFTMKEFGKVIRYLARAREIYPDHARFQAQSIYLTARSQDVLEQHRQAKETYMSCIDQYEDSADENVQHIVQQCQRHYQKIHMTSVD